MKSTRGYTSQYVVMQLLDRNQIRSVYALDVGKFQRQLVKWSAHQPHARCLQQGVSSNTSHIPSEVIPSAVDTVHIRMWAAIVPESAAIVHCTVITPACIVPPIIVTVKCGKHHHVVYRKSISCVTRVPRNRHPVIVCLAEYDERTVLGVVPAEIACLQIKPQLVVTTSCQLM